VERRFPVPVAAHVYEFRILRQVLDLSLACIHDSSPASGTRLYALPQRYQTK
jgi:hypothetical protein